MEIPSPEHVFNSVVATPFAEEAIKVIANKLNDPEYVKNNQHGSPRNPYFAIFVPGNATIEDKIKIASTVINAGWKDVYVDNAEEFLGPPNYVQVTIYRHNQAELKPLPS